MKLKNYFLGVLVLPFLLFSMTVEFVDNPDLMSIAQNNLPHNGVLKITPEGFLYLKISDDYIFDLLPLISGQDIVAPPYFKPGMIGAHISVAYENEMEGMNYSDLIALGEVVSFEILNFQHLNLDNCIIGNDIYILDIKAPRLSEIRTQLGLSSLIKGHDFHITVAISDSNQKAA
ncbi:MAG: hypothetical protein JHC93_01870 [Parachlamydiales bacterium]|nr:hypothetical protein [Parachlamydiales bacterium]